MVVRGWPMAGWRDFHTNRRTSVRTLTILVAVLSVIALTACGGAGDSSGQPHRNQAGPYIGGRAGVGF